MKQIKTKQVVLNNRVIKFSLSVGRMFKGNLWPLNIWTYKKGIASIGIAFHWLNIADARIEIQLK